MKLLPCMKILHGLQIIVFVLAETQKASDGRLSVLVPVTSYLENCTKPNPKCSLHLPPSFPDLNISKLSHPSHYLISDNENNSLVFNICKPLPQHVCSDTAPAGACLIRVAAADIKAIPVGQFSENIAWYRETFSIDYQSMKGSNFTTDIIFLCDRYANGKGRMKMVYFKRKFKFRIFWYTNEVCLSHNEGLLDSGSGKFNLSALTKQDGFYSIEITESNETIFLNPFQPLPPDDRWETGALAALVMENVIQVRMPQTSVVLGRRLNAMKLVDEKTVSVLYDLGDPCPLCPGHTFSMKIFFRFSEVEELPIVIGVSEFNCQVVVEWKTMLLYQHSYSDNNKPKPVMVFPVMKNGFPTPIGTNSSFAPTNTTTLEFPDSEVSNKDIETKNSPIFDTCYTPVLLAAAAMFVMGCLTAFSLVAFYYCCCRPFCSPYCQCYSRDRRTSCIIDCCCCPGVPEPSVRRHDSYYLRRQMSCDKKVEPRRSAGSRRQGRESLFLRLLGSLCKGGAASHDGQKLVITTSKRPTT